MPPWTLMITKGDGVGGGVGHTTVFLLALPLLLSSVLPSLFLPLLPLPLPLLPLPLLSSGS